MTGYFAFAPNVERQYAHGHNVIWNLGRGPAKVQKPAATGAQSCAFCTVLYCKANAVLHSAAQPDQAGSHLQPDQAGSHLHIVQCDS
jgi:hypothetical protein